MNLDGKEYVLPTNGSPYVINNNKQPFLKRFSFIRKCITYPIIAYLTYSVFIKTNEAYNTGNSLFYFGPGNSELAAASIEHPYQLLSTGSGAALIAAVDDGEEEPIKEIFEVTLPIEDYGVPVYTEQYLTNYSFGNSWGKPAVVEYTPPNVEFNKVVVNISTFVDGVQYDRLAHLYLNNVQVWRTSTGEPGGKLSHFNASKDLSDYLTLFKQSGELAFQLDNLINSKLTGVFNVTIEAYFYNYVAPSSSELYSSFMKLVPVDQAYAFSKVYSVLKKPANKIISLESSLKYLPNDDLSYDIKPVSKKTVAGILRLFVTGNAAEEFWYSNVFEENKKKFELKGHHLLGKGPVRKIHIYLNDQLISIQAPPPVIYTGGISPSLWNPVVGTAAFDIKAIDVNLTPYLPLLWTKVNKLRVEVVTGPQHPNINFMTATNENDEIIVESTDAYEPGSNWIASGALLFWENPAVTYASGFVPSVLEKPGKQTGLNFGNFKPDSITQIVSTDNAVSGVGILKFGINGTNSIVEFGLNVSSALSFSNVQTYKNFGDKETVVSNIRQIDEIAILNVTTLDAVSYKSIKTTYATILTLDIIMGPEINYDVSLVQAQLFKESFNGKKVSEVSKHQNGTSLFTIAPTGNHGVGNLTTRVAKSVGDDFLCRKVDVLENKVISDSISNVACDSAAHDDDDTVANAEALINSLTNFGY